MPVLLLAAFAPPHNVSDHPAIATIAANADPLPRDLPLNARTCLLYATATRPPSNPVRKPAPVRVAARDYDADSVDPVLAHLLILWAVVAVVLGVILSIRKGREVTGLRYAGIFGFVGAAFGVIIGMTTFFASQHFSNVSQSAEREANAVGVVAAMSGAFPPSQGRPMRAQLFCYATDVIEDEWQRSNDKGSPAVAGRERAGYVLLLDVGRGNPKPYNWYSTALSSSVTVGQERQDRLLQSSPQIPVPLWILLYAGAALIVVFAFFFHLESRGQLIGMNVAVFLMLTAVVAVLAGLDAPTKGPFGQEPDAMKSEQAGLALDLPPAAGKNPKAFCEKLSYPANEPSALR
jgi:hypothetical protein